MTTTATPARAELQAWYLESLRPKLERAAGTGTADATAVDTLDRLLEDFLGRPDVPDTRAA